MLNALTIKPPLDDLYKLIDKVPRYPLNNRQLVEFASKIRAPKEVINFYRTFNEARVYEDRNELMTLSEQIDLLRREEAEMPPEIERGPEDF